jgi:hypothetical protein
MTLVLMQDMTVVAVAVAVTVVVVVVVMSIILLYSILAAWPFASQSTPAAGLILWHAWP